MLYNFNESEVRSYCRNFPVIFGKSSGEFLYDNQGKRYIDFLSACGALNYGHNHPILREALLTYISNNGVSISMDLETTSKNEFMESFQRIILSKRQMEYRLQFTGPTGTNAVEAAIKLARKVTGRLGIVAFTRAFHGCTLGSLALTANRTHRSSSEHQLIHTLRLPYDGFGSFDEDAGNMLDCLVSDPSSGIEKPAAIILETIQGEGGMNSARKKWLVSLAEIARKHKIILIIDDIQAGCGRTGNFFSFEYFGIKPDLVCLAKSISGFGLPMSLVLIRPDLDVWAPGEHNGTFRGNNLAFVTAKAALENFWSDQEFQSKIKDTEYKLDQKLKELCSQFPCKLKGRGLMRGIEFQERKFAAKVQKICFEKGLILETSGPQGEVLKLLPPLTVTDDIIDNAMEIIRNAIFNEKKPAS